MLAVREINMPNNCEECKFCINQKTNDYGSFGKCLLQQGEVNCLNSSRDTDCPLVEIVTCKNCKHNDEGTCYIDGLDYFCSSAERKE